MMLIPAIDLRGGRVVRLQQGDYARETRYEQTPLELARAYRDAGARRIHLVDLDAARAGGDDNLETIARIARSLNVPVQTGGGVRAFDDVKARLDAGANRVVIGSLCVQRPADVCAWLEELGPDRIVAGLDVKRDEQGRWVPQASGWTEAGDRTLEELIEELMAAGLLHVLCTDISRDGMLTGPGLALYEHLAARYPGLRIQASGGIGREADLERVAQLGVYGCIVGRALLEGRVPMDAIGRYA